MENSINNSISQFSNDLLNHLNQIKQAFKEKETPIVAEEENKTPSSLSLKKAILEREKEIALSNFDIGLANKLSKELAELNLCLQTPQAVVPQNNAEQEGEMQRELTHEAFLKLKQLPQDQIQEVINTTPQLKTLLGDWFSALTLWLGK